MNDNLTFRTTARWMGNRSGRVEAEGGPGELRFSAPPEFHGRPGQWTPETLFLASAGTCFVTTLVAIAGFMKLELADVEVAGETTVEHVPGQGYQFREVVLWPVVTLARESDREKVLKALDKAEKNCLVARALSTPLRIEAKLRTAAVAKGA